MNNATCRWGIIGAGDVCEHKGGPPLYQVAGNQLIGVTRRNRLAGEDYARRHGSCRYFESVEALLAEPSINCIYVASPPALHAAHTIAAAEAGKHILCEKPMAIDSKACVRMVESCNIHDVTFAVAYYRRGYPAIQRAKTLLDSSTIGKLDSIWLNTQFPISHRLDLVQFFCGDILSVRIEADATDQPVLRASTRSGAELHTSLGFEESNRGEQVRLRGKEGEIFVDDLKGGHLVIQQGSRREEETFPALAATHQGIVENFRDHLAHGDALSCDGETGRKSSVVLDHVSNLAPSGNAVTINYQSPPKFDAKRGRDYGLLA